MAFASIDFERVPIQRGYTDRLLAVDLTTKTIEIKSIAPRTREMFVGGRGYCLKLVFDGTRAATQYDSPENVLALAGGPFCGETGFAGTGKFIIGAISPLTGTFCDSNVGGYFFPLVKKAGFDAISITGKADAPVAVFIDADAGNITIQDAPQTEFSLFGVEDLVDQWKGDGKPTGISFVTTGKGAGNTRYGCVNSIYYDQKRKRCRAKQAGRGGLGTVMTDKNLWGVVIKCDPAGGFATGPANKAKVREAGKNLRDVVRKVDPGAMDLGHKGTTVLVDMMNPLDLLPVNNYQYGSDERAKDVGGDVFSTQVFNQKHPDGCFAGCNLGCTKGCDSHTLLSGPLKGKDVAVDGPEYETAAAVTNLGIFNKDWILEYAWYCDEYGVDTISAGVAMAFCVEAFERGFLTEEDTGGRKLTFGDAPGLIDLLHDIAAGEPGFPTAVGRGIRYLKGWISEKAAAKNGKTKQEIMAEISPFAMECKGLEFSMYITKESLAQQGGYGFALKGPQHDEAWLIAIDQVHKELPTFELKADALKWFPLFRTWFNIVGLCKLPWIDVRHPDAKDTSNPAKNFPSIQYYVDFVNAMLGTNKSLEDLLTESERSYLLHKLINLRQGFGTREFDRIPLRAMAPVFPEEFASRRDYYLEYLKNTAGIDIKGKTDEELLAALHDYRLEQYEELADFVYKEKGYDNNSVPTDETLDRLGFEEQEYRDVVMEARQR